MLYLVVSVVGDSTRFDVNVFDDCRIFLNDCEAFNVLVPISLKFKWFRILALSVGRTSRYAGVTTLSVLPF